MSIRCGLGGFGVLKLDLLSEPHRRCTAGRQRQAQAVSAIELARAEPRASFCPEEAKITRERERDQQSESKTKPDGSNGTSAMTQENFYELPGPVEIGSAATTLTEPQTKNDVRTGTNRVTNLDERVPAGIPGCTNRSWRMLCSHICEERERKSTRSSTYTCLDHPLWASVGDVFWLSTILENG